MIKDVIIHDKRARIDAFEQGVESKAIRFRSATGSIVWPYISLKDIFPADDKSVSEY
jgi:hypothetical protein